MVIIRLLLLGFSTGMTVITVAVGVAVLLGMGWLAVAVPVLLAVGILAAARAVWCRCGLRLGLPCTGIGPRDP